MNKKWRKTNKNEEWKNNKWINKFTSTKWRISEENKKDKSMITQTKISNQTNEQIQEKAYVKWTNTNKN